MYVANSSGNAMEYLGNNQAIPLPRRESAQYREIARIAAGIEIDARLEADGSLDPEEAALVEQLAVELSEDTTLQVRR